MASIWAGLEALDRRVVALADGEVVLDQPAEAAEGERSPCSISLPSAASMSITSRFSTMRKMQAVRPAIVAGGAKWFSSIRSKMATARSCSTSGLQPHHGVLVERDLGDPRAAGQWVPRSASRPSAAEPRASRHRPPRGSARSNDRSRSGKVLRAARLTTSREVTSAMCSTSTRSWAFSVAPVDTRSTMRRHSPSIGASSTAPLSLMHSAWTPRAAKCRRVISGYLVAIADMAPARRVVGPPPWRRAPPRQCGSGPPADPPGHRDRGSRTPSARRCRRRRARRAEGDEGGDVEAAHQDDLEFRDGWW